MLFDNEMGKKLTDGLARRRRLQEEKEARNNDLFGSILGFAGSAIGTVLGGPIGGAIGGSIGSTIGSGELDVKPMQNVLNAGSIDLESIFNQKRNPFSDQISPVNKYRGIA